MPDAKTQNIAWLLEVSPNWYMSPFIFKKALIQWLLGWGIPSYGHRFPLEDTEQDLNTAGILWTNGKLNEKVL